MRYSEIFQDLKENATAGATGAASVASISKPLTNSIGAGFDPDGDWGVYQKPKKKKAKEKPVVIRRPTGN